MLRALSFLIAMMLVPSSAVAEITGRVRYDGAAPKTEPLDFRTDPVCSAIADRRPADHTLIGPKLGLANVFVHVVDPPQVEYPPATEVVVLDQHACRYEPKVFGIRVGQPLEIRNGDPTVHTTHALTDRGFNVVTPRQGQRIRKAFSRGQVMVEIRCDVHPWMAAYAGVLTHPYYAVTDTKGRFTLPAGLPDGAYTLELWHEKLGRKRLRVQVVNGTAVAEAVFRAPDPS